MGFLGASNWDRKICLPSSALFFSPKIVFSELDSELFCQGHGVGIQRPDPAVSVTWAPDTAVLSGNVMEEQTAELFGYRVFAQAVCLNPWPPGERAAIRILGTFS